MISSLSLFSHSLHTQYPQLRQAAGTTAHIHTQTHTYTYTYTYTCTYTYMEMQSGPKCHQRHRELSQLGERTAAFKTVAYLGGCPSVPGSTSSGSSGSSGGWLGSGGALTITPTISICTPAMDIVPCAAHGFVSVTRMRKQAQAQTCTHRHKP